MLALAALVACKDDVREVELTREHHSRITLAGVAFATVFERDANEKSPLLVMLHKRGDTPEHFRSEWHDFPVKLQLALPQAPLPFEHGFAWFDTTGDADTAEAALWPAIVELAHGRKVFVSGIDQGAAIALAMAARHADAVACVIPIGGTEITPATYDSVVAQVRACVQ